jgi:hypothetical protein
MTKEDAIKLIKLLSALESWAFSTKNLLPDYLHEDLSLAMEKLEKIVLKDNLDNMSASNKRPLKEYP